VKLSRIAPWISRLVLLAATFILVMIGRKFIGDPAGAADASNMVLGSPLAVTNMRASFGAFPLGCAIFSFLCLFQADRRLTGLLFVAIIIGTALAVRIFGVMADGTLAESLRLIVAESVLLGLSLIAILGESAIRSDDGRADLRKTKTLSL
jgi:Domain of unknown function (DUF4345)